MTSLRLASLAAASLLGSVGVAAADPSPAAPALAPVAAPPPALAPVLMAPAAPEPEGRHSINVSPLGILFGDYVDLTYEYLFDGGHGLVVDASFGHREVDDASATHGGVGLGYRWHWSGRQDSGFLGVMFHHSIGEGSVEYGGDDMSYAMDIRSTTLTANIGKRWMIRDDWNITMRLGLGWGSYQADAQDLGPRAQEAEDDMNDVLSLIPVGFDGELSFGRTF